MLEKPHFADNLAQTDKPRGCGPSSHEAVRYCFLTARMLQEIKWVAAVIRSSELVIATSLQIQSRVAQKMRLCRQIPTHLIMKTWLTTFNQASLIQNTNTGISVWISKWRQPDLKGRVGQLQWCDTSYQAVSCLWLLRLNRTLVSGLLDRMYFPVRALRTRIVLCVVLVDP